MLSFLHYFYFNPERVPRSSNKVVSLIIFCCLINIATIGYDSSMMNTLNILPQYTEYFKLTSVTLGLNTASINIGTTIGPLFAASLADRLGRKCALVYLAYGAIVAVVLQAAAQNIAMFVISRILVGAFTIGSCIIGPMYAVESLPAEYRTWGVGSYYTIIYVGSLLSACITYGTAYIDSTWAWRVPSALQGIFSIMCVVAIPWLPESPRWLIYNGRLDEALLSCAQSMSNSDITDLRTIASYEQMVRAIAFEKDAGHTTSWSSLVKTKSARKRVGLVISVAVVIVMSGISITSYYLGTMLANAGVTEFNTQLQINIYLQIWCIVCSIVGTWMCSRFGRRILSVSGMFFLMVTMFLIGALTKLYGTSTNTSAVYATIAMIFLFFGAYAVSFGPLVLLYPAELLNYTIRSKGLGLYAAVQDALLLMVVFVAPIALEKLGYIVYMMNGAWNFISLVCIMIFWVETGSSKTLEEVDQMLDGVLHIEGKSPLDDGSVTIVKTEEKGKEGRMKV